MINKALPLRDSTMAGSIVPEKQRKPRAQSIFSRRKRKKRPPLTLVGSPPVIHLLQWKFNTMDPRVSFLAVGQKNAAVQRTGQNLGGTGREGVNKRWGKVSSRPGYSLSGYRRKTTRKGCVFKQLFSKMELVAKEPIRARLRRLPLLCGLEPWTPHCTLNITQTAHTHGHNEMCLYAVLRDSFLDRLCRSFYLDIQANREVAELLKVRIIGSTVG